MSTNETITRPHLDSFQVFRDGELDRRHEVARHLAFGAKMVGFVAWKGFEMSILALDAVAAAGRASRSSE